MVADSRRFQLVRYVDHSGVSGTGMVATGAAWPDGTVALHWFGHYPTTTVFPGPNGIEALRQIHGHDGSSVIEWIDPEPPPQALTPDSIDLVDPDSTAGPGTLGWAARSLDPLCPEMGTLPPKPPGHLDLPNRPDVGRLGDVRER